MEKFLGTISYQITQAAIEVLQTGDAEKIGMLMKQAQEDFDKYLIPTCIDELTSPVLHHLLNYPPVQDYIFGGKYVVPQGD